MASKIICGEKTLMGLQPFEVRIFVEENFTNVELALQQIIKNHLLKVENKWAMMCCTI